MTISGDVPTTPIRPVKSWFGHPGGLLVLFLTEVWERFSFYGMRAILQLFMTAPIAVGGFAMAKADAFTVYSIYNSMVYLMALPGGWIADRLIGTRRSVLIGGIIIASGHYVLATPFKWTFWLGLVLIIFGTGMLKPNISAMVGQLYDRRPDLQESRRDAGFTLFYMGINLGAFVAPLITGWFQEKNEYHIAFGIAAIGMTIGVIQYVLGGRKLEGVGLTANKPATRPEIRRIVKIGLIVAAAAIAALLIDIGIGTFEFKHIATALALLPLGVALAYFLMIFRDKSLTKQEHSRVTAYVFIFLGATLFWMIYDQAGSVVTDFTNEKVKRAVGSFEIPTPWFASINAVLILILAPFFAWLWVRLGRRNPSTSKKFSYALMGIGFSFLVMASLAAAAGVKGLISPWWIALVYLIQTVSELLLSPVGLSVTTKLAPLRYAGQIMGLWFLATACGNAINTWVTPLVIRMPEKLYYGTIGCLAILMGLCFWITARKLTSLMDGVH